MMSSPLDLDSGILFSNQDWAVVRGNSVSTKGFSREYFFVYLGQMPLESDFMDAASHLSVNKKQVMFTGFQMSFVREPSPGFIVNTKNRWDFETPPQAEAALEKILWEINRLSGHSQ